MNEFDVRKEMKSIINFIKDNLFSISEDEVIELYRRYLYLESRVSTNSPSFKDDKGNYRYGNCYCYALGFTTPDVFSDVYGRFKKKMMTHNIGFISGNTIDVSDPDDLMFGFEIDMGYLRIKCFDSEVDKPNMHNGYKVSLYRGFKDFHFTRQNIDGSWSHKVGYRPIITKCNPFDVSDYDIIHTYEIVKPLVRRFK